MRFPAKKLLIWIFIALPGVDGKILHGEDHRPLLWVDADIHVCDVTIVNDMDEMTEPSLWRRRAVRRDETGQPQTNLLSPGTFIKILNPANII